MLDISAAVSKTSPFPQRGCTATQDCTAAHLFACALLLPAAPWELPPNGHLKGTGHYGASTCAPSPEPGHQLSPQSSTYNPAVRPCTRVFARALRRGRGALLGSLGCLGAGGVRGGPLGDAGDRLADVGLTQQLQRHRHRLHVRQVALHLRRQRQSWPLMEQPVLQKASRWAPRQWAPGHHTVVRAWPGRSGNSPFTPHAEGESPLPNGQRIQGQPLLAEELEGP